MSVFLSFLVVLCAFYRCTLAFQNVIDCSAGSISLLETMPSDLVREHCRCVAALRTHPFESTSHSHRCNRLVGHTLRATPLLGLAWCATPGARCALPRSGPTSRACRPTSAATMGVNWRKLSRQKALQRLSQTTVVFHTGLFHGIDLLFLIVLILICLIKCLIIIITWI